MSVAGRYECVLKVPVGEQRSVMTVNVDGDSWSGTSEGPTGLVEITEGKVDGNKLTWSMSITVPIPMKLSGTATVDGDTITGLVKAGVFGSFQMTGRRLG